MAKMIKMGPREMQGKIWDLKGISYIYKIYISHDQCGINSIQFSYRVDDDVLSSETYGEPGGMKFNTVTLDYTDEFIVSLSGVYISKQGKLMSIVFGTNKGKYGPFGKTSGTSGSSCYDEFNYEFGPSRDGFGGFHGSVYNGFVYAIGVYVKPCESFYIESIADFVDEL